MLASLMSATVLNKAISLNGSTNVSDISSIGNGKGSDIENLIEYSGRLCYRSTAKMGSSPTFINKRVKEGHEDIIEHGSATVIMAGANMYSLYQAKNTNQHISTLYRRDEGASMVTANMRSWLDLFRKGHFVSALPEVRALAPRLFDEFDSGPVASGGITHSGELAYGIPHYCGDDGLIVALLAYTPEKWRVEEDNGSHFYVTFLFEGISRACSHQLVRHRLASLSQESQRYVDLNKGGWSPVTPPSIQANPDMLDAMSWAWGNIETVYKSMRKNGIRKEDARFLLPNATSTRIVVTMHLDAWKHFFWLRALDKAAQWEIRKMGQVALEMMYQVYPQPLADHWGVYKDKFGGKQWT